MQRDIGNELIVAIIAVAVLAFALTFGIILSLTNSNNSGTAQSNVATQVPLSGSATVTVEQAASSTVLPTSIAIAVEPSETSTPEPPTATPVPSTATPEPIQPSETSTPEPPTSTPVPSTATPEPIQPSETSTPEPPTSTSLPPTATSVPLTLTLKPATPQAIQATQTFTPEPPTSTPQPPTSTPIPPTLTDTVAPTFTSTIAPTATPTMTNTVVPTATPTLIPTLTTTPSATPVPPTATNTAAPTFTPSATATLTPTLTRTLTLTLTSTLTPTLTTTPSATPTKIASPTHTGTPISTPITETPSNATICIAPFGWVAYAVQSGNTLLSIARATRSNETDLRAANCLENSEQVYVGDVVYVPQLPEGVVQTITPESIEPDSLFEALGCTDPSTQISSPIPGQRLSGVFSLYGTASLDNFWYYKIEVRADIAIVYNFYARSDKPVTNGVLGQVDTDLFAPGLYWIRLSVVDLNGAINTSPCVIPVIFE